MPGGARQLGPLVVSRRVFTEVFTQERVISVCACSSGDVNGDHREAARCGLPAVDQSGTQL